MRSAERPREESCEGGEEDESRSADRPTVIDSLKEFCGRTTCHGVRYLYRGSRIARLAWTLAVLAAFTGFVIFLADSVTDYLGYPSNTRIEIKSVSELTFPVFTFCNNNFLQASHVARDNLATAFLCKLYNDSVCVSYNGSKLNRSTVDSLVKTDPRKPSKLYMQMGQSASNLVPDALSKAFFLSRARHSFELIPRMTNYGLCHSLNVNRTIKAKNTGLSGGFQVVLHINQEEYAATSFTAAGVRVGIRSSFEGPFNPGEDGLLIGPGQNVRLVLHPRKINLLPNPYTDPSCIEENALRDMNEYSVSGCLRQCVNDHIANMCHCRMPDSPQFVPLPDGTLITEECSLSAFVDCAMIESDKFRQKPGSCSQCRAPCKPVGFEYRVTLSSDVFPSLYAGHYLVDEVKKAGFYNNSAYNLTGVEYMRENFALLSVYYSSLSYELIQQQKATSLGDLFGSVGGNLGLLTGASLLTLVEVGQFCLHEFVPRVKEYIERRKTASAGVSPKSKPESSSKFETTSELTVVRVNSETDT